MIVGQYLAANALITDAEEVDLYASMISCCADEGFTRVTFKPHPSAPATQLSQLHEIAGRRNIELVVANSLRARRDCLQSRKYRSESLAAFRPLS